MGAAANMQDRMAQMEAMDGAARCLETLRLAVSERKVFFLSNFLVSNISCTYRETMNDDDKTDLKFNLQFFSISQYSLACAITE